MEKARKKASFRNIVAYFFFTLLVINIALKVLGISSLDTSSAVAAADAFLIKAKYYAIPLAFLGLGILFKCLSNAKAREAQSYQLGGTNW